MKRLHVHVAVSDLQRSVGGYSAFFAAQPTVLKSDYAKWMLYDPRVNFAISTRSKQAGLDHLGIQVEDRNELQEVYARLRHVGGEIIAQGETACCYAKSEKSWIDDPAGISWEAFLTTGENTDYGDARGSATPALHTRSSRPAAALLRHPQRHLVADPERLLLMSIFERFLTVWVGLCIVVGVALGHLMPGTFAAISGWEVAKVNLPVAALIWLMIIPMLLKIDFSALGRVVEHARGVGVTLFVNWAVKPFSMALLGTFFIGHVFAPMLPAEQVSSYIAGLILLAAAPCTAMVFVWSNLVDGEPHYTLGQAALNDLLMVFLFAPLVSLLLGVASISRCHGRRWPCLCCSTSWCP